MATPLDPVPEPLVSQRLVTPDGRLTPEGIALLLAVVERINNIEPRVAALEP